MYLCGIFKRKSVLSLSTLDKIKILLRNQGKTQSQLTDHLGISHNVFTAWNSGRNKSYLKWLPQIAAFLGVSVDSLLDNAPAFSDSAISEQEKTLLTIFRSLSEEGRMRTVQAILNIRDEEEKERRTKRRCMR